MAEINFIKHIVLILRFLYDNNLKKTCRKLGRETKLCFHSEHFSELFSSGKWEKADKYLGGFTSLEKNELSKKLFFEIRKQKYLEALDRGERCQAKNILFTDLLFLYYIRHGLFEGCLSLLRLPHFRKHFQLASWKNVEFARELIASFLVRVLKQNPDTKDILVLPEAKGRLETLMRQSWKLQDSNCPRFMTDDLRGITTLLNDLQCPTGSGSTPLPWMVEDQPPPSPVSTDLVLGMAGSSLSTPFFNHNNLLSDLLAETLPKIPEGDIDHGDFSPLATNAPPADEHYSRPELGSSSGASRMPFGFNVDAGPSNSSLSIPNPVHVDLAPATGPEIIMEEEEEYDVVTLPPTATESEPELRRLFGFDVPQMLASATDPSSESERRPAGAARRKGKAPARIATGKPGPKPGKK